MGTGICNRRTDLCLQMAERKITVEIPKISPAHWLPTIVVVLIVGYFLIHLAGWWFSALFASGQFSMGLWLVTCLIGLAMWRAWGRK